MCVLVMKFLATMNVRTEGDKLSASGYMVANMMSGTHEPIQ